MFEDPISFTVKGQGTSCSGAETIRGPNSIRSVATGEAESISPEPSLRARAAYRPLPIPAVDEIRAEITFIVLCPLRADQPAFPPLCPSRQETFREIGPSSFGPIALRSRLCHRTTIKKRNKADDSVTPSFFTTESRNSEAKRYRAVRRVRRN